MPDDEKESIWRDPEDWNSSSLEAAEEELKKILTRFRKAREKKNAKETHRSEIPPDLVSPEDTPSNSD